jgi:hypothetical protein
VALIENSKRQYKMAWVSGKAMHRDENQTQLTKAQAIMSNSVVKSV